MSLRDWLRGGRRRPDREAVARVKAWAGDAVPGATIAVNEIICLDPGCPGTETVILVMQPGRKTRAAKIAKALDEVTQADVGAALSPAAASLERETPGS